MHRARRSARRRFASALAFLLTGAGAGAEAASLVSTIRYGTTGTIGADDVTGPGVVRFVGVDRATATTAKPYTTGQIPATIPGDRGSSLDLGHFEVAAPAAGSSTVYDHTPFAITLHLQAVNGRSPAAGEDSVVVRGWLDGTVGGGQASPLMAHYQLAAPTASPGSPGATWGASRRAWSTRR